MTKIAHTSWLLRSRLKIRQLLLLSSLGETGNLRRAAAELGMTQPAATKLLHELEAALNVELFERSRRGMKPTVFGEAMIRRARALLTDLDGARDEIAALSEGSLGTLALGTNSSTASELVPRAVAALLERHPNVRVSLVEGVNDMMMSMLRRGELDMVVGRVLGGAAMDEVDLRMLHEDEFVIVCGPRHPLLNMKRIELSDLVRQRWILPNSTAPVRQRLDILFTEHGGGRPRNAIESASLLTNLAMLQESNMVTVMPADLVRQFSRSGLVKPLPVSLPGLFFPVALITRINRANTPVAEAFIEELLRVSATAPTGRNP
ncbi:LysR family transcriptional regulator [Lacisediminimonas sp.]|uniref:LysR family transcriptional regulator n=1 Tax=Lacisediminimonas sp. TaxID=3060582 RepID=UPI0027246FFD|nr:LysR family transcriptional regulator [Lacisediminimonas sp.]MDO8299696.1 LysR family transcriptional regulator [Lacisediminimonas sp.]MDO9217184.1 LysR family transcriptional regulator [Lacisediminimonas sp.]